MLLIIMMYYPFSNLPFSVESIGDAILNPKTESLDGNQVLERIIDRNQKPVSETALETIIGITS